MIYVDNISITSTHTRTSVAKQYTQPYNSFFVLTKHNLTLHPDKKTCTLFAPDYAEYKSDIELILNNTTLPMATRPKVLGITLYSNLTYSTRIHNISVHTHKPLHIINTLTATKWGKQKQAPMATYKAVIRPSTI